MHKLSSQVFVHPLPSIPELLKQSTHCGKPSSLCLLRIFLCNSESQASELPTGEAWSLLNSFMEGGRLSARERRWGRQHAIKSFLPPAKPQTFISKNGSIWSHSLPSQIWHFLIPSTEGEDPFLIERWHHQCPVPRIQEWVCAPLLLACLYSGHTWVQGQLWADSFPTAVAPVLVVVASLGEAEDGLVPSCLSGVFTPSSPFQQWSPHKEMSEAETTHPVVSFAENHSYLWYFSREGGR